MEVNTSIIILTTIAIVIGIGLGIFIQRRKNTKQLDDANAEAKEILNQSRREADRIKSKVLVRKVTHVFHESHVYFICLQNVT